MKIKQILRSSSADPSLPRWFPGWFHERYGDHWVQISALTTLKLRSAAKDTSRTLRKRCEGCGATYETPDYVPSCKSCGSKHVIGFVPEDLEELSKQFTLPPMGVTDHHFVVGYTDEGTGEWHKGSSESGHGGTDEALLTYIERYPGDWKVVQKCLGLGRQLTRHAAGILIANRPIHEWIPVTTVSDVKVTAFTAPAVEAVGGVKMDFLVVSCLADIQGAIRLIQTRSPQGFQIQPQIIKGRRVPPQRLVPDPSGVGVHDIWDLPEDQAVFSDVAEGRTETVFQFGTPGAQQWLAHFNHTGPDGRKSIKSVMDMAAFTALDRKGPLDAYVSNPDWMGPPDAPEAKHNMLVEFARRARGAKKSPDIPAIMEEMLPETHSILVYQEQLQRIYQQLTGCTGPEAEQFRSDIAKKQTEKVQKAYPYFIEKATPKIGTEKAEQIFQIALAWAGYGFNKSHAVCYAITAYACAWLKHYYPLEWWCAVLKNATKDEINEKFWIHVGKYCSLPDLQKSQTGWVIEHDKLRAPLDLLHGVGAKAHEAMCALAPYASLDDLASKLVGHRYKTRTDVIRRRKNPKTGIVIESPGIALGRAVIQRKTIWTMIVAGAMDSMFPTGATVAECLDSFDVAMLNAYALYYDAATDLLLKKSGKSAYKSYEKSRKAYGVVDSMTRYQLRKEILPAYGADLRAIVAHGELPPYLKIVDGKKLRYVWSRWDRDERRSLPTEDPVVSPERLAVLNTTTDLPYGGYRCAAIAYLEKKDTFKYGPFKSKTALALTLDVGGGRYRFVIWPKEDGTLAADAVELKAGSIIAALLLRNKPDKPFSVKTFQVIRGPVDTSSEEEEEEST